MSWHVTSLHHVAIAHGDDPVCEDAMTLFLGAPAHAEHGPGFLERMYPAGNAYVQTLEADAFVASDLEGRFVLDRLGLSRDFRMLERPLGIRGVHVVASREHVQASELISAVNRGLKELKQTDAYAAIVRNHLMRLWNGNTSAP